MPARGVPSGLPPYRCKRHNDSIRGERICPNADKNNDFLKENYPKTYKKIMEEYYSKRTSNKKYEVWTYQIANYFSSTLRPYMNEFLSSIGFKLQKENYENNK